nr:uncharacterized protein LOC123756207 [Procambarus clarkii]
MGEFPRPSLPTATYVQQMNKIGRTRTPDPEVLGLWNHTTCARRAAFACKLRVAYVVIHCVYASMADNIPGFYLFNQKTIKTIYFELQIRKLAHNKVESVFVNLINGAEWRKEAPQVWGASSTPVLLHPKWGVEELPEPHQAGSPRSPLAHLEPDSPASSQVRDTSGGEGRVYMDGQLLIRDNFTFQVDNAVRDVIIGQDEFMPPYSLSGKMSQVNIWRRVLTAQEILDLARCKVNMVGDVVNWEGQWTMNDLEEEEVSLGELCESQTRGIQTIRLPLLSYHHAVQVCLALRGVIRAPTTIQELVTEKAVFKGYQELNEKARWSHGGDGEKHTNTTAAPPTYLSLLLKGCERQWGGANDEAQEGSWYNPFTKTSLNSSSLAFKEFNPDGGRSQNCLHVRATGLLDTDCNKNSCSACHAAVGNTWTLRGICEDEMRMYYFDLVSLPLSLRGYGEYKVEEVGHVWTWYNSVTNTTMATLINPKHLNYPFGRLPWKLMESVCGQENGTRVLTLSPCTSEEFTCTDGTCIPFLLRCDLKFDCDDKTDETQCNIINFPSDYRSKLPPRPGKDKVGLKDTIVYKISSTGITGKIGQ